MSELGKIERVFDLREIWPHEAHDFTKWLAKEENLALLSDEIGIDIVLNETESSVGSFNVDIFAYEAGTSRKIIIENQLEATDHDHLGKIITYASGKEAEIIIWIVMRARDEHRKAIEWLNQHTDEKFGFFLLEIELWRINDSPFAPKFNIIESPNDWAKVMKTPGGDSSIQKMQMDFWNEFIDSAAKCSDIELSKPRPRNSLDVRLSPSNPHPVLYMHLAKNEVDAAIYIHGLDVFDKYHEHRQQIEAELGMELQWMRGQKDSRITATYSMDLSDRRKWQTAYKWYCEMIPKLQTIISKYRA